MPSFRPETPADGPVWLPRFASSIADLFRRTLPAPLKLFRAATSELPPAAGQEGALAWDATAGRPTCSDGTDWIPLAAFAHAHALADIAGAGSAAAKNVGTSGDAVPLLDQVAIWSAAHFFSAAGSPVTFNSTNSAGAQARFQQAGTERGRFGASATYIFENFNPSGNRRFSVADGSGTPEIHLNATRVLTVRQPAIADDASGAANQAKVNAILSALRTHGLIAP